MKPIDGSACGIWTSKYLKNITNSPMLRTANQYLNHAIFVVSGNWTSASSTSQFSIT